MATSPKVRVRRIAVGAAALVALMGGIEPARAQIYEWLDEADNRHFANSLEQVPSAARARARLVVNAATNAADSDGPAVNSSAPSAADQSVEDTQQNGDGSDAFASGWDAGFDAGWAAGFRTAAEQQPICPAEPEVIVLESRPPVVLNVPRYDPSGAYYRSPYGGALTVPFDDGASRGLTRRQQIQELRSLERGW